MLKKGSPVPEVTLQDSHGKPFKLASVFGQGPVVFFFYPKDHTLLCTREACSFRDAYAAFRDLGATVVGISSDNPASHAAFAQRHELPYLLLSDPGNAAFTAFGLSQSFGLKERATFVVDGSGIVRATFSSRFSAGKHVRKALSALRVQRLARS